MMVSWRNIHLEEQDGVARVILDRPPLNVLDIPALRELGDALEEIGGSPTAQFLVLTGSGSKAFSAGVDVKDHTQDRVAEMLDAVHGVIRQLLSLPQITIALVQGACLGGGCELASSCDLLLAAEDSFFATPEINVGCYPPVALVRFPSQLGHHRAAELILTGRRLTSQEALAMGLVNRVAAPEELSRSLEALLEELKGKSGAVLRLALKGLREISARNFFADLKRSEEIYLKELLTTEDVEEGVRAFLEKRKPNWRHR
jgi:cyclohexa-1,5-dienecarbonyl-CoA hydratase